MPALLIISLTLIPAIMAAADGVLEDSQTPTKLPKSPTTPTPPVTQGSLIPLAGYDSPMGIWSDGSTM